MSPNENDFDYKSKLNKNLNTNNPNEITNNKSNDEIHYDKFEMREYYTQNNKSKYENIPPSYSRQTKPSKDYNSVYTNKNTESETKSFTIHRDEENKFHNKLNQNTKETLNNTESTYDQIKLNEVSNNNKKIQLIDQKQKTSLIASSIANDRYSKNLNNNNEKKFDEKSINNDFKVLDKLKNKIKDLETKIGEVHNGKIEIIFILI